MIHNGLFEGDVEVAIVQEHVRVVEPPIEMSLDRFDGLDHALKFLVPRKYHQYGVGSWAIYLRFEAAGHEYLVVLLAYFSVVAVSKCLTLDQRQSGKAYLMAGGAPAGIMKFPGEELCCTMSTMIKIMTIHGNKSTAPSGTEIFELPFSRIRLLKKDSLNLGASRSFSSLRSCREGRLGDEGIRFINFPTSPIAVINQRFGGQLH